MPLTLGMKGGFHVNQKTPLLLAPGVVTSDSRKAYYSENLGHVFSYTL